MKEFGIIKNIPTGNPVAEIAKIAVLIAATVVIDAIIKSELEQFKDMGIRVKILDIPTTLTDFPPEQAWVLEMINAILIEVLGAI